MTDVLSAAEDLVIAVFAGGLAAIPAGAEEELDELATRARESGAGGLAAALDGLGAALRGVKSDGDGFHERLVAAHAALHEVASRVRLFRQALASERAIAALEGTGARDPAPRSALPPARRLWPVGAVVEGSSTTIYGLDGRGVTITLHDGNLRGAPSDDPWTDARASRLFGSLVRLSEVLGATVEARGLDEQRSGSRELWLPTFDGRVRVVESAPRPEVPALVSVDRRFALGRARLTASRGPSGWRLAVGAMPGAEVLVPPLLAYDLEKSWAVDGREPDREYVVLVRASVVTPLARFDAVDDLLFPTLDASVSRWSPLLLLTRAGGSGARLSALFQRGAGDPWPARAPGRSPEAVPAEAVAARAIELGATDAGRAFLAAHLAARASVGPDTILPSAPEAVALLRAADPLVLPADPRFGAALDRVRAAALSPVVSWLRGSGSLDEAADGVEWISRVGRLDEWLER